MIGARFVVMTLLVFAAGAWSRLFHDIRELRADAQAAVWFATGLVTLTVEMLLFTAIGGDSVASRSLGRTNIISRS